MLFNTLAYAEFFAIVFVGAWALVERRLALVLPWAFLVGYVLTHRTPLGLGLCLASGAVTVGLLRLIPKEGNQPVPPKIAGLQLSLQLVALWFLTSRDLDLNLLSYGRSLVDIPTELPSFHQANIPPTSKYPLFGLALEYGRLSFAHLLYLFAWALVIGTPVALYALLVARKGRLLFILFASYVFYANWDVRFLLLIWASSSIDWWLGKKIAAVSDPRIRKWWLTGTVILNLGVLGFFKYFNFGIDSARSALEALGYQPPEFALRVALPVGISFFTFESMSYVIDVYRKELEPQKSYAEYLSFVAFFPHLVAGPIVRPRDLLPQLAGPAKYNPAEASEGLFLIAVGLGKKIVVGDYLALNLIDRVFDAPLMYSALEVYAAILGYALQIYCDFSGYTDIAIGSALLLGVRFPLNFNSPYKAHNIVDFWRRWHISLSTWLRDYLYIPLGGNRKGKGRTYFNLLTTMVLGGLWHGAAWTFVVWGSLHGAALAVTKWWHERGDRKEPNPRSPSLFSPLHILSVFLTVHLVCAGWVFFRAESFEKASLIFAQLATLTTHHPNLAPSIVGVLTLGIVGHYMPNRVFDRLLKRFSNSHWSLQALGLTVVAIILRKMASTEAVPFVYFQF